MILRTLGCPSQEDCEFIKDEAKTKLLIEMHKSDSILESRLHRAKLNAINLVKIMLEFNPNKRATIQECLEHPYFESVRKQESKFTIGSKIRFDFEDQKDLTKEDLRLLFDEELEYYKKLREANEIKWSS